MSIREDSKKIIQYFLREAIECGDLTAYFSFEFSALTRELNLESEKYCKVCFDYLREKKYLRVPNIVVEEGAVQLLVEAVDFLEST